MDEAWAAAGKGDKDLMTEEEFGLLVRVVAAVIPKADVDQIFRSMPRKARAGLRGGAARRKTTGGRIRPPNTVWSTCSAL